MKTVWLIWPISLFSLNRPSGPRQPCGCDFRPYVVCMLYVVCCMLNVVCPLPMKFITSGCRGDLWSKNVFLIWACDDTIKKKGCPFCTLGFFFPRLLKHAVVDQPTVDNVEVSRGRSVAATVGCCLLALR